MSGVREERKEAAPIAEATAEPSDALTAEATAEPSDALTAEATVKSSSKPAAEVATEPGTAPSDEAATGLSGAPTAKAAAASGIAPSAKAAASGGRLISKTAAALSETPSAEVTAEPGAVPPAEPSSASSAEPGAVPPAEPSSASSAASKPVSPDRSFLAPLSDSSASLRAAIFCFSDRGAALAERIAGLFPGARTVRPRGDLAARTAECFRECDALIFVGAAGIAVRAIAPHVAAKTADPAVIVADDCGRHVVSLLSGHIGGANRLTRQIAARIGAEPVVTTATDVNQRFSIDEWAARRGLSIESMDAAKRFSAEILRRDLPLTGDFPVDGPLPAGVFPGAEGDVGAAISCYRKHPFAVTALLSPRIVHLGIGCKRGAGAEAIAAAVDGLNLAPGAIVRAASIDVKAHEPGLLAFCRARGIEIRFYSAAELSAAEGEFTPSEFVKKTVGVDNVCERAAAVSAGPGAKIFIRKTRGDGVTVAAAMQDWRISFE